jgi:hypothetical protein
MAGFVSVNVDCSADEAVVAVDLLVVGTLDDGIAVLGLAEEAEPCCEHDARNATTPASRNVRR